LVDALDWLYEFELDDFVVEQPLDYFISLSVATLLEVIVGQQHMSTVHFVSLEHHYLQLGLACPNHRRAQARRLFQLRRLCLFGVGRYLIRCESFSSFWRNRLVRFSEFGVSMGVRAVLLIAALSILDPELAELCFIVRIRSATQLHVEVLARRLLPR